ncbi:MAG: glycosyltransferase family 39 protein [Candidatus Omnitrophota bacterium]
MNKLSRLILYTTVLLIPIILFRVPAASLARFSQIDEGIYAAAGNIILHGGLMYKDAADPCGPVTPYIYAFIFSIFGPNNMAAVHTALIFLLAAICFFLYLTGRRLWGKGAGYLAALFFAIFSSLDNDYEFLIFYTEWPAVFFSIIGVYLLLQYFLNGRRLFIFLSGFALGLAFFSKQIAAFNYLHALLFVFLFTYIFRKGKGETGKAAILILSGFASVAAITAAYFYINGAFGDLWFWFWEYHNGFYVPAISALDRFRSFFGSIFSAGSRFFPVNAALLLLFAAGAFSLIRRISGSRKPDKELFIEAYIFSWAFFSYLGITYSGRGFSHYFIMLLPPLCLAAGRAVYIKSRYRAMLLIVAALLALAALFKFHDRLYLWELLGRSEETIGISGPAGELTGYIRENSSKVDKIFVWGCYPEIYGEADRLPASRYINCNFLTGLIPWTNIGRDMDTSEFIIPMGWKIFQEEMADGLPLFIIDTSTGGHRYYGKYPPEKFIILSGLLKKYYKLDKEFFDERGEPAFRLYRNISN